jgi:hypothetical protein
MEIYDVTDYMPLRVHKGSEVNQIFDIDMKSEKKVENEPVHPIENLLNTHTIQALMNTKFSLALKRLIVFVAD